MRSCRDLGVPAALERLVGDTIILGAGVGWRHRRPPRSGPWRAMTSASRPATEFQGLVPAGLAAVDVLGRRSPDLRSGSAAASLEHSQPQVGRVIGVPGNGRRTTSGPGVARTPQPTPHSRGRWCVPEGEGAWFFGGHHCQGPFPSQRTWDHQGQMDGVCKRFWDERTQVRGPQGAAWAG